MYKKLSTQNPPRQKHIEGRLLSHDSFGDTAVHGVVKGDETNFAVLLDTFYRCTGEKASIRHFLETVANTLANKGNYCDLGSGRGEVSVPLAKQFETFYPVDSAQPALKRLRELAYDHKLPDVHDRLAWFQHINWLTTFDFMTMIMALGYNSKPEDKVAFITSLQEQLNPGGALVVVETDFSSGSSLDRLATIVKKDVPGRVKNAVELLAQQEDFAPHRVETSIRCKTAEEMVLCLRLLLYDVSSCGQEALEAYTSFVTHHCLSEDPETPYEFKYELVGLVSRNKGIQDTK